MLKYNLLLYLMKISDVFAENLKRIRKDRGLTQEELAEKVDSSKQMIANIEAGRVWARIENIELIASALKIESSELFLDDSLVLKRAKKALEDSLK